MSASRDAIDLLSSPRNASRGEIRKSFARYMGGIARGKSLPEIAEATGDRVLASISKAAANSLAGVTAATAELYAAYVASLADGSLLDAIMLGAVLLPPGASKAMVASGFVADAIAEGYPKINHQLTLSAGSLIEVKPAAIVAFTKELEMSMHGQAVFETELRYSQIRGANAAVLAALVDSDAAEISSTGDALGDLRAGIAVASASRQYVVAATWQQVADLATRAEVRGDLSPAGGTFVPGIRVVPVDDINGMHVFPVDRIVVRDFGLEVRRSEEATLDLGASPAGNSTTPTATSSMVSLWQTNTVAMLAERMFGVGRSDDVVIAVVGS